MNVRTLKEKFSTTHLLQRKNIFQYLFLLIVVIQTGFLIYMNLFAASGMIDYDGAKLYKHAIEMWNNKTAVIPGWKYITTMELDCALLPAVFFYGICHNIFLSFGLSNIIMIFCYIAVIYTIFQRTKYREYAFLAICLVLVPYQTGMLEYFNMLFFNGAQYGIKVLLPLLFVLLLTTPEEKRKRPGNIVVLCIFALLLFITSLSSGVYVMFCGLFPIFLCMAAELVADGGMKKYKVWHFLLCGISIAAFLSGTIAARLIDVTARGNGMLLSKYQNMQLNVTACITGLFQVLNAIPGEDTMVLSLRGILFALRILLVLLLLFVCFYNMRKFFRPSAEINIKKLLSSLFLWNFAILIFADTRYSAENVTMEYRYYLIAFIPLMLVLALQIGEWMKDGSRLVKRCVSLLLLFCVITLTVGSDRSILENRGISQYVNDICAYINSMDQEVDSVFFVPDEETPEMCRLLDESHTYCGYSVENGNGLVVYDYYQSYIDRSSHGDNNLLFVYNWETPDMYLPAYISGQYEKVGSVRWFDVYYSSVNLFDSISGFPLEDQSTSTDFFFSPGYVSNAEIASINDAGELAVTGNGAEAVSSAEFAPYEGGMEMELIYETEAAAGSPAGVFEVWDAEGPVYSAEFQGGANSFVTENIDTGGKALTIHIKVSEGVTCRLQQINFRKTAE